MASPRLGDMPYEILHKMFWPLPDRDLANATCVSRMCARVGRDVQRFRSHDLYVKLHACSTNLFKVLEADAAQLEGLKLLGVPVVYEALEVQRCTTALSCAATVPALGFLPDAVPLFACRVYQHVINSLVSFRQAIVSAVHDRTGVVMETAFPVAYV